jgi:hypothetical protein
MRTYSTFGQRKKTGLPSETSFKGQAVSKKPISRKNIVLLKFYQRRPKKILFYARVKKAQIVLFVANCFKKGHIKLIKPFKRPNGCPGKKPYLEVYVQVRIFPSARACALELVTSARQRSMLPANALQNTLIQMCLHMSLFTMLYFFG